MPLFGHLDDSAFLVFSRGNRYLYAEAILLVYRQFFSGSRVIVPLRDDVVETLTRLLRQRPELWQDQEEYETPADKKGRKLSPQPADEVARKAYHVYTRLSRCGWIEEEPHGFNAVVEMPPAAMALADQFDAIERGLPQLFGGVVVDVKATLDAIQLNPSASALGLPEAAANAVRFTRRLRAILSSLRAVQRTIMASPDLKTRLDTFFEDFIGRILVADYKATFSYAQHPLRFRAEVARMARSFTAQASLVEDVAQAYMKNGVSPDHDAARREVFIQLNTIAEIFEAMPAFVSQIEDFRVRLERRLRNTIRYMDRTDDTITAKMAAAMCRLDALRTRAERHELALEVDSLFTVRPRLFAPGGLAEPRAPRAPIQPRAVQVSEPDPVEDFREYLSDLFEGKLEPDEATIAAYLDKHVAPGRQTEGKWLKPTDLAEFAALDSIVDRLSEPGGDVIAGRYTVALAEGQHASEWLEAPNFTITPAEED